RLAAPEQDRRDREVHLVDEARLQILADRGDTAAYAYVPAVGHRSSPLARRLDPVGDEMEDGAAFHLQRRTRMVREHEDRHVIRRIPAPPALPLVIGPGAADGPEHVAPHDPGADILERLRRELIVWSRRSALTPLNVALEGAGRDQPLVQPLAAPA